jgi:hypothetical protein
MADKLRTTYPVKIIFTGGEQPDASKLTAISSQAKSGLRIVEKAIGDLWGTGGDANVKGLQIPTLGRVVGENVYLNPVLYELADGDLASREFYYIERLDLSPEMNGKTTGYLTFKPTELGSIVLANLDQSFGSRQTLEKDVDAADDYWIDLGTGRFRFYTPIVSPAGGTETPLYIGYKVDPNDWETKGTTPGIIPDPRSLTSYVTVDTLSGTNPATTYEIELPYRESLMGITEKHPEQNLYSGSNLELNAQENVLVSAGGHPAFASQTTQRLWSTASTDAFYKYRIPALELSTIAPGDYLPDGTVMLTYVSVTGDYEVIEGLRFVKVTETKVRIQDTAEQLQAKEAWIAGDTVNRLPNYRLITAGPSVTKTIHNLNKAFANHTHDGLHGEDKIKHSEIIDLAPAEIEPGTSWQKSLLGQDDHIQYLHRGQNSGRDINKGALLGNLILSENTLTSGDYLGDLGTHPSGKIYFGDEHADNPFLYAAKTEALAVGGPSPKLDFRDTNSALNTVRFESSANIFYLKKGLVLSSGTIEPTQTIFQVNELGATLFNTTNNSENAAVVIKEDGAEFHSWTHAAHFDGDTLVSSGYLLIGDNYSNLGFEKGPLWNTYSNTGMKAPRITSFDFEIVTPGIPNLSSEGTVHLIGQNVNTESGGTETAAVFTDQSLNQIMNCYYVSTEAKGKLNIFGDLTVTGNLNTQYITNDSSIHFAHSDGNNTSMSVVIDNGQLHCNGVFSSGGINCGNGSAANIETDNGNIFTESGWIYAMGTTDNANNGCKIVCFQGEDLVDSASHTPNNGFQLVRPQGIAGNPHQLGNLGNDYWNILIGSSGNLHFTQGASSMGYLNGGTNVGRITGTAGNFTGQHTVISENENIQENINDHIGLIVSSIGQYRNVQLRESSVEETVTINESLPMIQLASEQKDKKVFGVISDAEDPNSSREYASGTFVSILPKMEGDDRITVNSLGEGGIWVSNINGDLENGDYVTSCEVPGYGMKQDDDLLHNYTVAKITCDCNFDLNSTVYNCEEFTFEGATYRKAFVGCTYHCG